MSPQIAGNLPTEQHSNRQEGAPNESDKYATNYR